MAENRAKRGQCRRYTLHRRQSSCVVARAGNCGSMHCFELTIYVTLVGMWKVVAIFKLGSIGYRHAAPTKRSCANDCHEAEQEQHDKGQNNHLPYLWESVHGLLAFRGIYPAYPLPNPKNSDNAGIVSGRLENGGQRRVKLVRLVWQQSRLIALINSPGAVSSTTPCGDKPQSDRACSAAQRYMVLSTLRVQFELRRVCLRRRQVPLRPDIRKGHRLQAYLNPDLPAVLFPAAMPRYTVLR